MNRAVLLIVGGMDPLSRAEAGAAIAAVGDELASDCQVVYVPYADARVLSAYALRYALESAIFPVDGQWPPLILWAFSAGCVGATALATYWQRYRSPVLGVFLLDGWGVPRPPGIPTYRLSHDRITHDTAGWLGQGDAAFYADPPVPHRRLWQQIQATAGWTVCPGQPPMAATAADFLQGRSRACLGRVRPPLGRISTAHNPEAEPPGDYC